MGTEEELGGLRATLRSIEQRLSAIEKQLGIAAAPPPMTESLAAAPIAEPPLHAQVEPPDEASAPPPPAEAAPPPTPRPPAPRPNVETMIGAHWLNRIGIAALLIGVAFFLKYAFENEWIGPAARVLIGVASGIAIFIWSERFHARGLVAFGHSLKVIAAGVLYLSIWAASQTFGLIGSGVAFAAMTLVTGLIVAFSIIHRSEFLAALGLTCGFLTPILLSTGDNRQFELFAYVALLDVAALVLVILFPWARAVAVAFFGTLMLYSAWYGAHFTQAQSRTTIAFAALFFVLFAVVPLLRRWERGGIASGVVLLLPFANALVYFCELAAIVYADEHRLARHALILAGFFFALAAALRLRSGREDLSAAHLTIGIGLLTIAIPLRLDALWITIGWITEAAALLLISQRVPSRSASVFRLLGSFSLGLGVFRLLFVDDFRPAVLLWNQRMLVYAMAAAVFAGIAIVSERKGRGGLWKFAVFCCNLLMLIALTGEVSHYFNRLGGSRLASRSFARDFSYSALWMGYGALLMTIGFRFRRSFLRWMALALLGLTVAKVFVYDVSSLDRGFRILSFIILGLILLAISYAYQKRWLGMTEESG